MNAAPTTGPIELAADFEPDVVSCDRYEQFVELVSLTKYKKKIKFKRYFSIPLQPKDKKEEFQKQTTAYEIEISNSNSKTVAVSKD